MLSVFPAGDLLGFMVKSKLRSLMLVVLEKLCEDSSRKCPLVEASKQRKQLRLKI
jgi:hypothetical protein